MGLEAQEKSNLIKKLLFSILSQPPAKNILLVFTTVIFVLSLTSPAVLSMKMLFSFIYLLFLTYYAIGTIKKLLISICILVALAFIGAYASIFLEVKYVGITGVLFPSVFLVFAGTSTVKAFLQTKVDVFSILIRFVLSLSHTAIVCLLYMTLNNLATYYIIVIALIFILFYGGLSYLIKTQKEPNKIV